MSFEDTAKELNDYVNEDSPVTSLYLKLGPQERDNFKYTIILKNMVKELKEEIASGGLDKEAADSVESDLNKITSFIDNPDNVTECRGIAVFSCASDGLWEVVKLPSVYRNQLVIDRTPLTGQLLKIDDEYRHIVAVLVDRKKARIFNIGVNGASEIMDYFYPGASRTTKFHSPEGKFEMRTGADYSAGNLSQGFGEYGFNRTIENEIHQHYKYVAEKVLDYYRQHKFRWLILGGTEENIPEFSHHLHSKVSERLAGTVSLDLERVKPSQITDAALEAVDSSRSERHSALLEEFKGKLATGYAIDGIKPVWNALRNDQVRVLLVAEGYSQPGYVCRDSGILFEDEEDDCTSDSPHTPVRDLVDRAIGVAFGQGGEVEMLTDDELKKEIHGVGAILRFTI